MGYVEHTNGYGRTVIRRARPAAESKRSDLACPVVIGDTIESTRSVADGQTYTSMTAYKASLKKAGMTIADGALPTWTPPKKDRAANRAAIERAICDVDAGRAPPILEQLPV